MRVFRMWSPADLAVLSLNFAFVATSRVEVDQLYSIVCDSELNGGVKDEGRK